MFEGVLVIDAVGVSLGVAVLLAVGVGDGVAETKKIPLFAENVATNESRLLLYGMMSGVFVAVRVLVEVLVLVLVGV